MSPSKEEIGPPLKQTRDKCFLYDGPHWACDCPKRKTLNVMIEEREKPIEKGETEAHMSSLQLPNAINVKTVARPAAPSKGLLYVEAQVNGKIARAMIDTGATTISSRLRRPRNSD